MPSKKRPVKKKVSENTKECQELYEEIHSLKEIFNWTNQNLCDAIIPIIQEDGSISRIMEYDCEREKQFYEKLKKLFQKVRKESNLSSHSRTLLETILICIYKTDEYRESSLADGDIDPKTHEVLSKISKIIHSEIRKKNKA